MEYHRSRRWADIRRRVRTGGSASTPVVTLALVGALLSVFAIDVSTPTNLAIELAIRSGDTSLLGVLTAPFAHFSASHLLWNVVPLLIAGWYVEAVRGRLAVIGLAAAGALAGGLVALLAIQNVSAPVVVLVVGASPMVFAIVASAAGDLVLSRGFMTNGWAIGATALVVMGATTVNGLAIHGFTQGGGLTAAMHLAGIVVGLVAVAVRPS